MSKNQKKFWRALEKFANGAVMAEWSRELGDDAGCVRPYLALANELAETHPCINAFGCGYPHRVEERQPGQWLAYCETEDSCPPFTLTNQDLFVFAVDTAKLCSSIARALGFEACASRQVGGVRVVPVGTHGPARSCAYLMFPPDSLRMARDVERLFGVQPDPFLVLTPTGLHCSVEVESALRRQQCIHMPMSAALVLGNDGSLAASSAADSLLKEFQRRQAEGRSIVKTVERIDRNMEAVAQGKIDLLRENSELKQLHGDGLLKFVTRVAADDFRCFAVIMALGNRKAAADFLSVPHRTFYDRVDKWPAMSRDHQRMFRMVEWRKKSSRKIKVSLPESMMSGDAGDNGESPETLAATLEELKNRATDNRNYPDILRQVLEALQNQNAVNWKSVKTELVEMLAEEVPQ